MKTGREETNYKGQLLNPNLKRRELDTDVLTFFEERSILNRFTEAYSTKMKPKYYENNIVLSIHKANLNTIIIEQYV